MITIVDYGLGNLGSIHNMFKKIGAPSIITSDIEEIKKSKKILLPGVGAFDAAMSRINDGGFREVLDKKALDEKIPILGVCLGMQLITLSSEEGQLKGLGWIDAKTYAFKGKIDKGLKIPHMGWNLVRESNKSELTAGLPSESRFYFVHSYYVKTEKEENSVLKTTYGLEFDSSIQKGNIYGAQFHPEKSHKYGKILFENFARI